MTRRNLIIIDSSEAATLHTARQMALLMAPARYYRIAEFQESLTKPDDNFIIGGDLDNPAAKQEINAFLKKHQLLLKDNAVAFFAAGSKATAQSAAELADTLGQNTAVTAAIPTVDEEPAPEQLVKFAAEVRKYLEKYAQPLPRAELREHLEEILADQKHCTLSTGSEHEVRGTIISYTYHDGRLYAFCEGTRKFANILSNPNVCVTVFGQHRGGALAAGVQLFGTALIRYPGTEEYQRMFDVSHLKYDKIMALPFLLNGLEIRLTRAEIFWANWRKAGYDPRQIYLFGNA
jgi:menaquinone-dependent protoporphyrinogen IX oxidase/uncharacterized protein YhbP (UPF0306 family)